MQKMPSSLMLITTALVTFVLVSCQNTGRHPEEAAGHQESHGTAGHHHGPDAWNAPSEAAVRPNPIPATPTSIARGEEIYEQNCVVCHGEDGKGDGLIADKLEKEPANLQVMAPMHPPGDLAWKIGEGHGAMPKWNVTLSQNQIWDVVNYLKYEIGQERDRNDDHDHGDHDHGDHHH